ncbi:MAG: hypothetical protein ABL916_15460 [Burkholderiaceae bacterium]
MLRTAYRASGGIARGDDLARFLNEHHSGDFVSLAMSILEGELFAFQWQQAFWVPMFQFDLRDLWVKPNPNARRVLTELAGEFDGWALALWFAQPNDLLHGARPVDLLDASLPDVLQAARTDRFIAAG